MVAVYDGLHGEVAILVGGYVDQRLGGQVSTAVPHVVNFRGGYGENKEGIAVGIQVENDEEVRFGGS